MLQVFGTLVVLALLPLSIARAILRYHLWDVDIIVRKTLVYTLLTGFLLLVYLTSIVVLQGILSRLTGQDSTLATILSTLLIAGLFRPARRRGQTLIARRFYRRQLDAVPSTAAALPAVAEAVGDQGEVLVDGGVRTGIDVVKFLALGAKACLIGRAWAWAVAGRGEAGVAHVLQVLHDDIDVALGLTGVTDVRHLDPSILLR